jgi:hypothetical protein
VAQTRLRSSFIYLANAVNDLRGNWGAIALILAPLVLASSLCLLPEALNLQARVANTLSGAKSVEFHPVAGSAALKPVQEPYRPEVSAPPDRYPQWLTATLHYVAVFITLIVVNVVTLCLLGLLREDGGSRGALSEAIETYRRAIRLTPAFLWVAVMQFVPAYIGLRLFVIPGVLVFLWLYFAEFALVFDGRRGFLAITRSYELIRGRFFKVATRILVFLAVWWGYNSWTAGIFLVTSWLMGPVAVHAGFIWSTIFVLDILWVSVAYATAVFFLAAGARLYQDLAAQAIESAVAASQAAALQDTGPLGGVRV